MKTITIIVLILLSFFYSCLTYSEEDIYLKLGLTVGIFIRLLIIYFGFSYILPEKVFNIVR